MPKFETSHHVAHSAGDMFQLVADVEHYPEFVPLCQDLKVRGRKAIDGNRELLVADMTVAYKFVSETFTSRVTLDPDNLQILVEYLDGPFKHLENRWTFVSDEQRGGCSVNFYIDYEFKSRALSALMGTMFDRAFRKFSTAFEERATKIYGASA
ncbi:type II toxin-antitoxin system RatA family toxin [Rhodobacteraceae bacterium RKSG542]|uniref:type II toxin-antitoxin system RatA family toxin n=1 Tax=Pseudovibrio flavus TaxID=2529854 RepID=UPI0012BB4C36|nr:type II toxin-antitoxin system RatA family toxin [Pseudovibrio flavus]MTI16094.1 type II toxin-antitoxin system RatA family toxin [Pseudovibrio flavus]